jgi:hypothetical protein
VGYDRIGGLRWNDTDGILGLVPLTLWPLAFRLPSHPMGWHPAASGQPTTALAPRYIRR